MAFVRFTEIGKSFKPKATITTGGVISLNEGAKKGLDIDNYIYCILYYDDDGKQVGIQLTNDQNEEGAIKIRKRKTGADIGAKSFLTRFKIDVQTTTMYHIDKDVVTGWLIIDLSSGRERKSGEKDLNTEFQE